MKLKDNIHIIGLTNEEFNHLSYIINNKPKFELYNETIIVSSIIQCGTIDDWLNIKEEDLINKINILTLIKDESGYINFNVFTDTNLTAADWGVSLGFPCIPIKRFSDETYKRITATHYNNIIDSWKSIFSLVKREYLLMFIKQE